MAPSPDTHHEQQGSPNPGALAQKEGLHEKQGTEEGEGAQSQGCQEGEKRQRLAEGSGEDPQALL